MVETDIQLNSREWAEVARAFQESNLRVPSRAPRPGSAAAILSRITTFVLGPKPSQEPDTPRRQVLRNFIAATAARRRAAEEFVPALLSLGLNRVQVEALAMLTLPGRSSRSISTRH